MSEIEVKHLSKTFEQKGVHVDALKDINLTIGAGDIYGIIGMSGAGKSTLVRCLNFLERPTDGQVLIEGKDLGTLNEKELRKQRSDIAMIFQHFNLLMQKNVIDNICFPLQIQGVKKKEARAKARELLKTVGLEEKEKAYPAQLSGGQKQRVAIAMQLIKCKPGIKSVRPDGPFRARRTRWRWRDASKWCSGCSSRRSGSRVHLRRWHPCVLRPRRRDGRRNRELCLRDSSSRAAPRTHRHDIRPGCGAPA